MGTCGVESGRFLVLNKKADWDRGWSIHLEADDEGLRLPTVSRVDPQAAADGLPPNIEAQDLWAGSCARLYVLDRHSKQVWIYYADCDQAEPIRCIGGNLSQPWGVAASEEALFIACGRGEHRLTAFAHRDWQILWSVSGRRDAAGRRLPLREFTPFAVTVGPGGNPIALAPLRPVRDQSRPAVNRLAVLEFDPHGRLLRFSRPRGLRPARPVPFLQLAATAFLAASPDGSLYVLDSTANRLFRLPAPQDGGGRRLVTDFPQAAALKALEIEASGLAVDAQGTIFVGDRREVPPAQEDPRLLWAYNERSDAFQSVPGYRGAIGILFVGPEGRIYIYDPQRRRVFVLRQSLQQLSRVVPPLTGRFYSASLDSRSDGTRWHRVLAELTIPDPADHQVRLAFLSSDDKAQDGIADLDDLVASRPVDQESLKRIESLDWVPLPANPEDALIQDAEGRAAEGRYLWLRIELQATRSQTPALHSLRLEFPRDTYLRYLPSVYQQDDQGRLFLERFLSIFQSFLAAQEIRIDHVARYFDYEAVSGEFLRWLAHWVAIAAREEWSEEQLRDLIRRSPQLHRQRGTRQGIQEILEILTPECPILVEPSQLDCPSSPEIQEDLLRVFGGDPYTFWVLLPTFRLCRLRGDGRRWDPERLAVEAACLPAENLAEEWAPQRVERVRRLVAEEKPAHTVARVAALREQLQLDQYTFLGLNSRLGESLPRLGTGMTLGRDTLLEGGPNEPGQVERRSRVEADTSLT